MSDITKCQGLECPLRFNCMRYLKKANPYLQAWLTKIPYKDGKCKMFKEIK